MFSIRALLSALVTISAAATVVARAPWFDNLEAGSAGHYTLQVAAFPDEAAANRFVARLLRLGEKPVWGTIDLGSRGRWIRVFIGSFATAEAARQRGKRLVSGGAIKEFIIRPASEIRALGRPRTSLRQNGGKASYESRTIQAFPRIATDVAAPVRGPGVELPAAAGVRLTVASFVPIELPRLAAVRSGMAGVADGRGEAPRRRGGLWISGDIAEAMARLRWIAGAENADVVIASEDGRLDLDDGKLAKAAGVTPENRAWASLLINDHIYSNEGLLLLTQLTQGPHRYRLHLGRIARTLGGEVRVDGSINLDNNFDRRINPYRNRRQKLGRERPPEGFDSLVAINPSARWLNLQARKEVPCGNIVFHELAEAHAKIARGLEYLQKESRPGAHSVALEREIILRSQRPGVESVVTVGSNRVFRSEEEIRRFKAEFGGQD